MDLLVKTIVFRVDASIEMGAGHVMRCLTLADELSQNGHKCTFISRRQPGSLINLVKERGYSIHELPECEDSEGNHLAHGHWLKGGQERDVEESLDVLEKLVPEWLVIDHYGIDKAWEQRARNHVKNILVIDDLADRPHDCDILVDQNLGRAGTMYSPLVPKSCRILTGCQYALLRPEFLEYRKQSLEYRRKRRTVQTLLVTMGGVDKDNYTGKALDAIESSCLTENTRVNVVLGKESPWLEKVKRQAESSNFDVRVLIGVTNMAELMSKSDMAIGAAGGTSWERCCLGVPTILCVTASNQIFVADGLERFNAALLVDLHNLIENLREQINRIINSKSLLKRLSDSGQKLVDGKGADRVVKAMLNLF